MRQDAYLDWALKTGFSDARLGGPTGPGRPEWLWLLLQLDRSACEFQRMAAAKPAGLWVPPAYGQPPRGLEESTFCTALLRRELLEALARGKPAPPALEPLLGAVVRFEIGPAGAPPPADASAPVPPPSPDPVHVVVGIIDDGLAFAHRRFCTLLRGGGRRTRLLSLWDQGAAPHRSAAAWGLGRLHLRADIDQLLAAHAGPPCDEDAVYAAAGYPHVRRRQVHGTHVMDLACGADAVEGDDHHAHIVGVQLPPAAVVDTSCSSMVPHLLDGVRHVLAQADAACPGRDTVCPVVINLSLGNIAGPHDGSSLIEEALDEALRLRRSVQNGEPRVFSIVLPEGNGLQSRAHAWADMDSGGEFGFDWQVLPDDGTSSRLELWLRPRRLDPAEASHRAGMDMEVSVQPPRGGAPLRVRLDMARGPGLAKAELQDAAGRVYAMLSLHAWPANGRHPLALLTLAPTVAAEGWDRVAPSGCWRVTVHNHGRPSYCNAYVQRDDIAFGRPGRGRQGLLEDGLYRRFEPDGRPRLRDGDPPAFVRRAGTLNALAGGQLTHVVGGLRRLPDGAPAAEERYSAVPIPIKRENPARSRRWALTEDSLVLRGVLAAGSRSGCVVAMNGTSVAAPQFCRELAGEWLKAPRRTPAELPDMNGASRPVVRLSPEQFARLRRRLGGA